ncbi:MAG: hypothetical protein ACK4NS_03155 [Saprospiraceae bacterium]
MRLLQNYAGVSSPVSRTRFFAPVFKPVEGRVGSQIQRDEDSETEPPRPISGEKEIEVIALHDIESGATELSAETREEREREISEELAEVAQTETSGGEETTRAGLRFTPGGGPLSFAGGLTTTRDGSGSEAYPFFRITLGGERRIFRWLAAEGEANLSIDGLHRTPALDAEGRLLFLPRETVAPFVAGDVSTEEERARLRAGVQFRLPNDIQIRASIIGQVGFDGNVGLGGAAGIVIPIGSRFPSIGR